MSNYPKESSKPNCFKNQGSIAWDYAVTSDDDSSKLFKTNILVYAVKSDDAAKTRRSQYPGAMLQAAMMIRKPTKPISMFFTLTSVNDRKTRRN